ncbi:MAG TPA: septum formation protein Maf, partial [Candidatus Blautia gallistercoris]|nr:septum formation protein Maf [Candidatus Blautia gallistercoris]
MKKIVLASASPRRRELLEKIGVTFTVVPTEGDEKTTKTRPEEVVEELAFQKASENRAIQEKDVMVIGSDTVVAVDGRILGKPGSREEAVHMLQMIQGRIHQVYTGVAVLINEREERRQLVFHEKAQVEVYPMTEEEIQNYVATGEPMDKAGAYGIQGSFAVYVKKIDGDYNTIVGFPVSRFYQEL